MKDYIEIENILGVKPEKMAKLFGCSLSTYYRYRKGKINPDTNTIQNLLNAFPELSPEWLFRGVGPVLKKNETSHELTINFGNKETETFVRLPLYSLNHFIPQNETTAEDLEKGVLDEFIVFSQNFLDQYLEVSTNTLIAVHVSSHTMDPTIPFSSICLVDTSQQQINSESIYLIEFNRVPKLKIIQTVPYGYIRLSSINSIFPPIEIAPEENGFKVHGKAVWMGKRI